MHAVTPMVVAVAHATLEHVGHGLKAAVGVRREASNVVLGPIGAELIEKEEGVQFRQRRLGNDSGEFDACPIGSG